MLKQLKPNCYEVMIEIFKLQHEQEFFIELTELKLEQEIYRDVVFIASLFPEVLNNLESLKKKGCHTNQDVRYHIIQQLII